MTVSINANTGLLYTPVDYDADLLQSANDRVYTVRGERQYRPDYGLEADYSSLESIPVSSIRQAFMSDPRFTISGIESVYPSVDIRGFAVANPYAPDVRTLVESDVQYLDPNLSIVPREQLYIPGVLASNRTHITRIEINGDAFDLYTDVTNLDEDSEVYSTWYLYINQGHYSWLVSLSGNKTLDDLLHRYTWIKDAKRLESIRSILLKYSDTPVTLAFVSVSGWSIW